MNFDQKSDRAGVAFDNESRDRDYPDSLARRRWFRGVAASGIVAAPAGSILARNRVLIRPPAVFDVSEGTAIVNLHVNEAATLFVAWSTDRAAFAGNGEKLTRSAPQDVEPARSSALNIVVSRLPSATTVYYAVYRAAERVSEIQQFTTPPSANARGDFTIAFSGDMEERYQPFRIFDTVAEQRPDAFLHLGDTIYADIPRRDFSPSLKHYRRKHAVNRDDRILQRLMAHTAFVATWDDHEIENDAHGGLPAMAVAEQAFREYWPARGDPSLGLYRRLAFGSDLVLFVLDTRRFRSVQAMEDGPEKTMLGTEQKLRFLQDYRASKARFRLVATSVPFHGSSKDAWGNYATERDELLAAFRAAHREHDAATILLSADYHFAREWPRNEKQGVYEFMAGPLGTFLTFEKDNGARERHTRGSHFVFGDRFNFGVVRYVAQTRELKVSYLDDSGKLLHSRVI
jgi:phosphodiesterase/alkaline phosphatase D-like protein